MPVLRYPGKLFHFNPCPTLYQTQPYPAGYLAREPERLYTGMALISPLTPFMLRNVYLVLVLAALAATSAAASPVSPAKAGKLAHRKTVHATAQAAKKGAAGSSTHARTGRRPAQSHSRASSRHNSGRNNERARVVHSTGRTPQLRRVSLVRRRIYIPASPLKGSFESLARQNERAQADGLERILDEQDLADRIEHRLLVPIPESGSIAVNTDLTENH